MAGGAGPEAVAPASWEKEGGPDTPTGGGGGGVVAEEAGTSLDP